jgi:hypothetical protein
MKQKLSIGLGLVAGAGIGIIASSLFSLNIALSIVLGSALGLIVGSLFVKKKLA